MPDNDFDFQDIFFSTLAPLAVVDDTYRVVCNNHAFAALLGESEDTIVGTSVIAIFKRNGVRCDQIEDLFDGALDGKGASMVQPFHVMRAKGETDDEPRGIWLRMECMWIPAKEKRGPMLLLRLSNATNEVRAIESRESFAEELQHRIGNVLTLAQIIARKTARTSIDMRAFVRAYERRIRALGRTHTFLSKEDWDGMTIKQILETQILLQNHSRADSITLEGLPWRLSVLHAQTFAMAVHELLANAAAFGALSVPDGRIAISWERTENGSYHFEWIESGLTDLREPEQHGFGMQMICQLLPGQLEGKVHCDFTPTGLHYGLDVHEDVTVPVSLPLLQPHLQQAR
ncbi:sensor histidine kinase [Yoonia sediminilitoris]|uniref:histidine kinase n=1 Tax=Yoonia sediminilitoris TaxID=1286148 RepID=A0A2T6KEU4_9RHOB|nr:sensor histidine kinase [Yoonia sediminilitoris]PUB13641.1 two-component sensor histidine kinase [Yoonia sediminilitoris]RCW94811.1 two-component sensor histidine kinase [Yoonia sediminilitoris]